MSTGAGGPPIRRPWLLPAAVILAGGVVTAEGLRLPLTQQYVGIGAGFMVLLVGIVLLVLGAILAWQVRRGDGFGPEEAEGADASAPPSMMRLGWAAAGVALPILTIPLLGFPLAGGLAYACVTRAFGSRRPLVDVLIGVVVASVSWLAFTRLGVQLGPFLPFLG